MQILGIVTVGLLSLSLTACAKPYVVSEPAACSHPIVDVTTNGGKDQALLDYHAALELCNKLNGY